MDTPVFDLSTNGTVPDQYATEAGLESRLNTALEGLQGNVENYGRHGWIEDLSATTGGDAIVGTRRAAFTDRPVYETGKKYVFRAPATNVGAVTMQIGIIPGDVEPARPVLDADGSELEPGEIVAGRYYTVRCGADTTRNYRLVGESIPAKERRNLIETTGVIALANVSGRNAITADLPPEAAGITVNRTGIVYRMTVGGGNTSRTMSLKIGDGPELPIRAMDGSLPKIGDTKTDGTYQLRLYGPAATDPHFRLIAGVDRVGGGDGSLSAPVEGFEIAVPGDYADLQEAFDAARWIRATWVNIVIASGHLLTKGLRADGASAAHIRITYAGTGAVKLAAGFVGADNTDADPLVLSAVYRSASNLFVFNGGSAPTIACLFDMEHKDGNGYAGVHVQSQVEPNCGVINAGRAGFVQQGGSAHALYSKFGGAGGEGVRIQQGCTGSFQGANVDGSQSITGIRTQTSQSAFYASRASSIQFQDGSAKNSGGHGIGCHRCWISATNADVSGATFRAIEVSHGGRIVLNDADLSNAGEYAIAIGGGAGVLVNANGANLKGAGIASVYPTEGGSIVSLWGAMTNSTPGTWVRGTSYVPVLADIAGYNDASHPISFNSPGYRGLFMANVLSPVDAMRGGTAGQVLAKLSGNDFDFEWQDQSGGGSGGVPTSRTITPASGYLEGGGSLAANRTFDLSADAKSKIELAGTAAQVSYVDTGLATKEPLHGFLAVSDAARDLAIADNRKRLRFTHATPALTIRQSADVAYATNTLVEGSSANPITITGASGVTVNGALAGSVNVPANTDFRIEMVGGNSWAVTGRTVTGLPAVSGSDNGKALIVTGGAWAAGTLPASLPAVTGSDNGKVLRVVSGGWAADTSQSLYVVPEDYSGTTEAKLDAAIAAAISAGKPLWLGGNYSITTALTTVSLAAGQRLDIILAGSLTIAADIARPIVVEAVWPSPTTVSGLPVLTTYTMDGGASATECIKVTSPSHGCAVGDLVKLVADDQIPGEISTDRRVGEYFRVGAVSDNDVYLAGRPIDAFTTGIRLQRLNKTADFSLTGGRIKHTAGQTWQVNALTLRGLVGAVVDTEFQDGYDCGLQTQSCVMGKFRVGVWGFVNKISTQGISAYGMQDCCGWLNEIEVYGAEARHFVTTGSLTTAAGGATYQFGRTIGLRITGSVMASTSAAFDLHSSAYGCVIHDASVTGGSAGEDGSGVAYQLRGRNNRVVDCSATGSAHGVQLWAQAAGDGWDLAVEGFSYAGDGDAIRMGGETGQKLKSPRVSNIRAACSDNLRSIYITQAGLVRLSEIEFAPTGSATGSNAIVISASVDEVWVSEVAVNLTDFTGANYDLVAFSSAANTKVVVAGPSAIDPSEHLRSWVNGNGATSVAVDLFGLPDGVTLTGGTSINATGLTVNIPTIGVTATSVTAAIHTASTDDDLAPTLASSVRAAIEGEDPDAFLTTGSLADRLEDAALLNSGTDPISARIGKAVFDAQATLPAAELLDSMGDLAYRAGGKAVLIPAGAAAGNIVTVGSDAAANVVMASTIAPAVVTPTPNTFAHVNASSAVEYITHAATALLVESAMPANTLTTPVAFASGVLSYNPYANRFAKAPMSAAGALAATLWDNLTGSISARLLLAVDGTNRALNVNLPDDGLHVFGATSLPVTLTANTEYLIDLGRLGTEPFMRISAAGFAAATPLVQVIDGSQSIVATGNSQTLSFATKPTHQAGDLILAFGIGFGGSTFPTKPSDFTDMSPATTSSAPGVGISYKVATSNNEALSGWVSPATNGNGARIILVVLRKAGGTPTLGTLAYWKAATTPGGADKVTWNDATLAQRGIYIGLHALVSTDTGVMRSGISLKTTFGSSNRVMLGWSDATAAGTLASVTTDKTGDAARSATVVLPVY